MILMNECIDSLSSVLEDTVFLILGSDRSSVMDILTSFTHPT